MLKILFYLIQILTYRLLKLKLFEDDDLFVTMNDTKLELKPLNVLNQRIAIHNRKLYFNKHNELYNLSLDNDNIVIKLKKDKKPEVAYLKRRKTSKWDFEDINGNITNENTSLKRHKIMNLKRKESRLVDAKLDENTTDDKNSTSLKRHTVMYLQRNKINDKKIDPFGFNKKKKQAPSTKKESVTQTKRSAVHKDTSIKIKPSISPLNPINENNQFSGNTTYNNTNFPANNSYINNNSPPPAQINKNPNNFTTTSTNITQDITKQEEQDQSDQIDMDLILSKVKTLLNEKKNYLIESDSKIEEEIVKYKKVEVIVHPIDSKYIKLKTNDKDCVTFFKNSFIFAPCVNMDNQVFKLEKEDEIIKKRLDDEKEMSGIKTRMGVINELRTDLSSERTGIKTRRRKTNLEKGENVDFERRLKENEDNDTRKISNESLYDSDEEIKKPKKPEKSYKYKKESSYRKKEIKSPYYEIKNSYDVKEIPYNEKKNFYNQRNSLFREHNAYEEINPRYKTSYHSPLSYNDDEIIKNEGNIKLEKTKIKEESINPNLYEKYNDSSYINNLHSDKLNSSNDNFDEKHNVKTDIIDRETSLTKNYGNNLSNLSQNLDTRKTETQLSNIKSHDIPLSNDALTNLHPLLLQSFASSTKPSSYTAREYVPVKKQSFTDISYKRENTPFSIKKATRETFINKMPNKKENTLNSINKSFLNKFDNTVVDNTNSSMSNNGLSNIDREFLNKIDNTPFSSIDNSTINKIDNTLFNKKENSNLMKTESSSQASLFNNNKILNPASNSTKLSTDNLIDKSFSSDDFLKKLKTSIDDTELDDLLK